MSNLEEKMESGYRNMTETAIAKKIIEGLHDHLKLKRNHIGVIAPYRAQIKTLSDMLPSDVEVDTVDKFQGMFSRSNQISKMRRLFNPRIFEKKVNEKPCAYP